MSPNFIAKRDSVGGVEVVSVVGELDQATAPQLREALESAIAEPGSPVLADLDECEFIDSTGLSLLVEIQRRLAEQERRFAVCCSHEEVTRLLELTGIDATLSLFATREDGLAELASTRATD